MLSVERSDVLLLVFSLLNGSTSRTLRNITNGFELVPVTISAHRGGAKLVAPRTTRDTTSLYLHNHNSYLAFSRYPVSYSTPLACHNIKFKLDSCIIALLRVIPYPLYSSAAFYSFRAFAYARSYRTRVRSGNTKFNRAPVMYGMFVNVSGM
jgi:hypothetical protein